MIELVEEFGIDWNDRTVLVIAPGAAGLADSLRSESGPSTAVRISPSEMLDASRARR